MKFSFQNKSVIFTMRAFAALILLMSISCSSQTDFDKAAFSSDLRGLNGEELTFGQVLENGKGKVTVIEIWASWCSDCIKSMPEFKELQKSHPDLNYVFISFDKSEESWKKGIAKHALTGSHFWAEDGMTGEFANAVDADWIPRFIVIDEKGKPILYKATEKDLKEINTILKQKSDED